LLTAFVDEPTGYGRIIRAKDDHVLRIVEERDATPEIRSNNEINTSIYAFRRDLLGPALLFVAICSGRRYDVSQTRILNQNII